MCGCGQCQRRTAGKQRLFAPALPAPTALFATLGARYNVGSGLSVSGSVNAVSYRHKGLAPLSMPAHNAFSNIDSRVAQRGNWLSVEANYSF